MCLTTTLADIGFRLGKSVCGNRFQARRIGWANRSRGNRIMLAPGNGAASCKCLDVCRRTALAEIGCETRRMCSPGPGIVGVCASEATRRHPGGNPGANLESISLRCYLREVAFEWELTKEAIYLPLGCLQGGVLLRRASQAAPVRPCTLQPKRSTLHRKHLSYAKLQRVRRLGKGVG